MIRGACITVGLIVVAVAVSWAAYTLGQRAVAHPWETEEGRQRASILIAALQRQAAWHDGQAREYREAAQTVQGGTCEACLRQAIHHESLAHQARQQALRMRLACNLPADEGKRGADPQR